MRDTLEFISNIMIKYKCMFILSLKYSLNFDKINEINNPIFMQIQRCICNIQFLFYFNAII